MTENVRRIGLRLLTFLTLTAVFAACSGDRGPDSVSVGDSRARVQAVLGTPTHTREFVKTDDPIWGPEEEFWDEIESGSRMECWTYEVTGGQLNLYFVNGSEKLDYKAFAPDGVVY